MTGDMKARPSLQDAQEAIRVLFEPDQVVELRALGDRYITSGYYDNHQLLAADTIRLALSPEYHGIYWTLQQLNPALLARSPNTYRERARVTTSDPDVSTFRWVLIDLDPVRPGGISSSDKEKAAAHAVLEWLLDFFRDQGIEPVVADSGNGYHLLLRVDLPSADAPLVRRFLEALAGRFDTEHVKIDRTVFNPARISKAYGTVARKGTDVADRPHRAARLLHVPPEPLAIVARTFLEELGAEVPEKKKEKGRKADAVDLEERAALMEQFLTEGGVGHGPRRDYNGGFKWQLDACPFNSGHTTSIVTITSDGALGFFCPHNSCSDKHWAEFRAYVEEKLGRKFIFNKSEALSLVSIEVGPNRLAEMIVMSEQVLHGIGLKYFERNSELVHTAYGRDFPDIKGIHRAKESVVIKEASYQTIVRDLDMRASYFAWKKGELVRVHVPSNLPGQIHDRVRSEVRAVPYPHLDMVSASPVLLPSGSVSQQYYEQGVLFAPNNPRLYTVVPDHPTKEDAQKAMHQFDDIFCKFPFVDPNKTLPWDQTASYAVVLAKILSLVARPYAGPVPLFGFNAPTHRSGKTRADEAATGAALGHKPTTVHFTDEEEFGKHLQPLMRAGDRAIQIDNVEGILRGSKLNILLTGGVLRDRVLGESRDVLLTNNAVFSATGNNLAIGGDLTARALRCDIDPQMEKPEGRSFDFDPVERAVERHPQLVIAALLTLRAYLLAGAPRKLKRASWGGFERWDYLVCGALTWLGYADPFEARDRVLEADPVREGNVEVLEEWFLRYKDRGVSLRQIKKDRGEVYEALLKSGQWDGQYARWILRRLEGRVLNGYRLIRLKGRSRFRVERMNGSTTVPASTASMFRLS